MVQGQRSKRLVIKLSLQYKARHKQSTNKSYPSKVGGDKSYLFKETFTCRNKLKETVKLQTLTVTQLE